MDERANVKKVIESRSWYVRIHLSTSTACGQTGSRIKPSVSCVLFVLRALLLRSVYRCCLRPMRLFYYGDGVCTIMK